MKAIIAKDIVPITPDDDNDLSSEAQGLHCNTSGLVKMKDGNGRTVTIYCLAGVSYPYAVRRVFADTTTATGIHAVYLDTRNV